MVRCVVATCKLSGSSSHTFPKDEERRAKWVNFVRLIEPGFGPSPSATICGAHFDKECFDRNFEMEEEFGYITKRRSLRDDAVPTIIQPTSHTRTILPRPPSGVITNSSSLFNNWRQVTKVPILILPKIAEASQCSSGIESATVVLPASSEITNTSNTNLKRIQQNNALKKLRKTSFKNIKPSSQKLFASTVKNVGSFNIDQIRRMDPVDLVRFYSSSVRLTNSTLGAMRCRMGPSWLCPFFISCPNMEECESVMKLHLKKHVRSYVMEAALDPESTSRMNFPTVIPETADASVSVSINSPPVPYIDNSSDDIGGAGDITVCTSYQDTDHQPGTSTSFKHGLQRSELFKKSSDLAAIIINQTPSSTARLNPVQLGVPSSNQTSMKDAEFYCQAPPVPSNTSLSYTLPQEAPFSTAFPSSSSLINKKNSCAYDKNKLQQVHPSAATIPKLPHLNATTIPKLPHQNATTIPKLPHPRATTIPKLPHPRATTVPKLFHPSAITTPALSHPSATTIPSLSHSSGTTLNETFSPAGFIKLGEPFKLSPRKYLLAPSRIKVSSQDINPVPAQTVNLVLHPLTDFVNPKLPISRLHHPVVTESDTPIITKITGSAPKDPAVLTVLEKTDASTQVEFADMCAPIRMEQSCFDTTHTKKQSIICHSKTQIVDESTTSNSISPPKLMDLSNEVSSEDIYNSTNPETDIKSDPCLLSNTERDLVFLSHERVNGKEFNVANAYMPLTPPEIESLTAFEENYATDNGICSEIDPELVCINHNKEKNMHGQNIIENDRTNSELNFKNQDKNLTPNIQDDSKSTRIGQNNAFTSNIENFLGFLGLERTTSHTPTPEIKSVAFAVPIPKFRTRAQKKSALVERFFRKRKAEVTAHDSQINFQPNRKTARNESVQSLKPKFVNKSTVLHNLRRHSVQKFNLSRLQQSLKESDWSDHTDVKGYNLRRANMLKKRAHDQVKQPPSQPSTQKPISQTPEPRENAVEEDVPYTPAEGEVMRMPVEGLAELFKEEKIFLNEFKEEDERKRKLCQEMEKIKRQEEEKWREEDNRKQEELQMRENEISPPPLEELVPKNKLVLKRMKLPQHLLPSGNGPMKFRLGTDNIPRNSRILSKQKKKVSEIEVNGKIIQIKHEPSTSDDEDYMFDETSSQISDDDWRDYKPKLTVSNMLFERRKNIMKPGDVFLASQNSETEDSEDEETNEEVDVVTFSDHEFDKEKLFIDEIDNQDLTKVERILEIKKEAENIAAPSLSNEDLELLAFYNDHPYSLVEGDNRRDRMITIMARPAYESMDRTIMPQALVTETELRERERALKYLRNLKLGETRREHSQGNTSNKNQDDLTCMICAKKFTAANSMYYHYRSHAGVKPFKCEICKKSFTRLHSLNYHKMIHENITRFKCKYCDRGFRHPSHYKEHLNKHTGEEPFFCSICERRFKTSNSQRRHMRAKHNLRFGDTIKQYVPLSLQTTPSISGVAFQSRSPPLPDSPPPPTLPIKPFSFSQSKPVKLVLFPKNGISRVSYTDD